MAKTGIKLVPGWDSVVNGIGRNAAAARGGGALSVKYALHKKNGTVLSRKAHVVRQKRSLTPPTKVELTFSSDRQGISGVRQGGSAFRAVLKHSRIQSGDCDGRPMKNEFHFL